MKVKTALRRAPMLCALLPALAGTAMLAGCAAPSSYMGIDISSSASTTPPAMVSARAVAQNELSRIYTQMQTQKCPLIPDRLKSSPECWGLSERLFAAAKQARTARGPSFSLTHTTLSALASRAQSGDKHAQLELGIRFEEGRGVERDLNKARKLYAKAAASSGGRIWVYSPPVGNGTSGRVIPVDAGPKRSGLAEAKKRLEELE